MMDPTVLKTVYTLVYYPVLTTTYKLHKLTDEK